MNSNNNNYEAYEKHNEGRVLAEKELCLGDVGVLRKPVRGIQETMLISLKRRIKFEL